MHTTTIQSKNIPPYAPSKFSRNWWRVIPIWNPCNKIIHISHQHVNYQKLRCI